MANEQYKIILQIDGKDNASLVIDGTNRKVKELSDSADKGTKSAQDFGKAWDGFKNVATNLVGATALVAAGFNQVYQAGRAAEAAEITFNQVSGGVDNANASLARMRQLTGSVIDDMSLMKGANSLLVTGIAQTNEQAEELVNLGARLGSVMGVDAAESIANLNSALLNNSFMRLDTLGISAARVRERVNELKEAGLDMSAAFSQAVLEIGGQTLEDLGVAAGVAETAVARLSTRLQNAATDGAEFFAENIEKAATSVEQLIAIAESGQANDALNFLGSIFGTNPAVTIATDYAADTANSPDYQAAIDLARQYEQQIQALDFTPTTNNFMVEDALRFTVENPELVQQFATMGEEAGTYFRDAFASGNAETIAEARAILEDAFNTDFSAWTDEQMATLAAEADITFSAAATAQAELGREVQGTNDALAEQQRILDEVASADAFLVASTQAKDNLIDIRRESELLGDVWRDGVFSNVSGSMSFFDPEQLDEVRAQTEGIVAEYERLKELGESSDFTLVSELEVERAREIAESATATAEQAERNARAWENASLAMRAGATDGGTQNEFNQGVLANIEDPELRAQAEAQLNLNSGVETANTRVIDYFEALNAAIFEEFGVAAGTRAAETINAALEEGMKMGLSGEELQDYVEEQVGYALGTSNDTGTQGDSGTGVGGGQQVTVQAGDTLSQISLDTGIPLDELIAANGGTSHIVAGQVITVGDNQLIALDEGSLPETLDNAASNVLGRIGMGTSQADYNQPASDYTYYNPSTMSYEYSNDPASQPIAPETAEATTIVADDMLSIETSVTNIAATDTSTTFDPIITDVDEATTKVDEFQGKLNDIATMELSIELPISFVFDTQTAELLSRNSQVVEVIRLVLPQLGITPS